MDNKPVKITIPYTSFGGGMDSGVYSYPTGKNIRIRRSRIKWVDKILTIIFGMKYEKEYEIRFCVHSKNWNDLI